MKLNAKQRALIHEAMTNLIGLSGTTEAARNEATALISALEATMKPETLKDIASKLKDGSTAAYNVKGADGTVTHRTVKWPPASLSP